LINEYKSGSYSQRDLVEKYKVSLGTVSKTVNDSDKYLNQSIDRNKKFKRIKVSKNEKLNELVVDYIKPSNAIQHPISGPEIRAFASDVATKMDLNDFRASNGWLQKLNKRFDIRYKSFSGEASEVSEELVNDWKSKLSELTKDYKPENIFNFDESALFFKLIPKKSYLTKNSKTIGRKEQKQRITIGLCCSATGEKLRPVVIGTARKPRCFADINFNINSLGVDYYHNSNAWMTQTIFDKWLLRLDKMFGLKKRKVLLFVDNCSSHKTPKNLLNIEIKYLPSNTTSRLQPLDQGIIRSFKAKYRKLLLKYLTFQMTEDFNSNAVDFESLRSKYKQTIDSITLKNAMNWLTTAWDEVTVQTISNCFISSGFKSSDVAVTEDIEENISELFSTIESNIGETLMNLNEINEFESKSLVISNDWKNDLLEEALTYRQTQNGSDIEEIDLSNDNHILNIEKPSLNESIELIEKLEPFVTSEVPDVLIHFNKVKNALIELKLRKKPSVQSTITQYFK
jgi:hypothetical protein